MATARWQGFFKDAGIPGGPAGNYAVIFSDNRMRMDMLNELNKEILADLGINVMGDVIAILRHSKKVYAEISRSTAEEFDVNNTKSSGEKMKNQLHSDTKSKPATENILPSEKKSSVPTKELTKPVKEKREKPPEVPSLPKTSKTKKPVKSLSLRFAEYDRVPAKKWKEEMDEVITISVPVNETVKHRKIPVKEKQPAPKDTSTAQKISVFDRLGSSTTDTESAAGLPSVKKSNSSIEEAKVGSVFKRLGESTISPDPNTKQGALSSRFSNLSKSKPGIPSEPVLTVTVGKSDRSRLGLAGSQSVLRPVKHVKPIPRKPLAMDIEPIVQTKPIKGSINSGGKSKSVSKSESRTVPKSVFDRLGK